MKLCFTSRIRHSNEFHFVSVHFPVHTDGSNPSTPPEKPIRSSSSSRSITHRIHARKSKSSSAAKRFSCKNGRSNGEAKWYLDNVSSTNINNNNNNDSSAKSTPILDRPSRKMGKKNMTRCCSSISH